MHNDITNSNLNPAFKEHDDDPFGIPEDPDDLYRRRLDEEQEEIQNGTYEDNPPESLPEEDYIKHLEEDEMLSVRKDNLVFGKANRRDFIYKIPINRQDNEQEKEIKKILNSYIDDIDVYEEAHWILNYNQMIGDNTLGAKMSGKQRYIMGVCKILPYHINDKKMKFSRDGDLIYPYNGEYWMKFDINLFKEFLRVISNKLNVPEFLYLDYKFIDSIYKQLMQTNFFSKLYHSDNTLINLRNGTLLISSNKVELLDFHPDDGLTYQLDFEYNPNKVNTNFLDFLDDVLPDRDTQRTLQEAIGSLFIHF